MVKALDLTVGILVGAGAVEWGLIKIFNFGIVDKIVSMLSMIPMVDKIVYGAVGIAGVITLVNLFKK